MGVELCASRDSIPTLTLMELPAIRLSPLAGKSLVVLRKGDGMLTGVTSTRR
jgi:hypothetical protein